MTGAPRLFGAAKRGFPVVVKHADAAGLAALAGDVGREAPLDVLDS